jgi:hypothetical protein
MTKKPGDTEKKGDNSNLLATRNKIGNEKVVGS